MRGGVLLVEEPGLEIEAGGEVQVLVARAGVAVVADHAVGDEITRARRDIEQLAGPSSAARFRRLSRLAARPDRLTLDVALARDRGIERAHESQMLSQPAANPHVMNGLWAGRARAFQRLTSKSKATQAVDQYVDDSAIGICDSDRAPAKGSFGIEYAAHVAAHPFAFRTVRPFDQPGRSRLPTP